MASSKYSIRLISLLVMLWLGGSVWAANICDPTTGTQCTKVDTKGNAKINAGPSTRVTYSATASNLTAATSHTLSIESPSASGFKVASWCIGISNATAATSVAVNMQRRNSASSGGTLLTAEGTGNNSISKMDPAAASYGGLARIDGSLGTAGAILDQQTIQVGIIATGAGGQTPYCRTYGLSGEQLPEVAAGVSNGISITVPSYTAGSTPLSIGATIIVE